MSDKDITLQSLKSEGLDLPPAREPKKPLTDVNSSEVGVVDPTQFFEKKPEPEPRDFQSELLGDATSIIAKESQEANKLLEDYKRNIANAVAEGKEIKLSEEAYIGMQVVEKQLGGNGADTAIEQAINQNTEAYSGGKYDTMLPGLNSLIVKPKETDSKGDLIEDPDEVKIAPREILEKTGKVLDVDDEHIAIVESDDNSTQDDDYDTSDEDIMDTAYRFPGEIDIDETTPIQDDIMDDSDEQDSEEESKELVKILKSKVREKLQPHLNKLDISSFTVASPVKTLGILTNTESYKYQDCVLFNTGCVVSMGKFKGTEIEALGGGNNARKTARKQNEDMLKMFWNHLDPATRPSFEVFVKTVLFNDYDNLFFAVLNSTFGESNNFVPYYCQNPKCKDVEIVETNVLDMIKWKDEEQHKKYVDILENGIRDLANVKVEKTIVPISDQFAICVKDPTLYDVLIEPMYLSENNRKKYKDQIAIIAYLDSVYKIDYEHNQLVPIDFSAGKNKNIEDVIKIKYKTLIKFLDELDSDTFNTVQSLIAVSAEKQESLTYVIPEYECVKCKTKTQEVAYSAREILFTRHQLATLANL